MPQKKHSHKGKGFFQRYGILLLGILGAVLLGLVIYLLLPKTSPSHTADTPAPSDRVSLEDTVIHFVATGDLNITDKVIASGKEDFGDIFRDVAPLLAQADLTAVNLEGNIAGAPYGTATGSAPHTLLQSLQKCGVDMIQLANSYAINRGLSGLSSTIDAVRNLGMEPVGAFKSQQEYRSSRGFSLFHVKGIEIAVVAFTKGMDGMTLPAGSENCVNLLYEDYDSAYQWVNEDKINAVLDEVDKEKPDLVIALLHWGSEFNDNLSSTQYEIVDLLQDRGVDAIIGTHPHYVQKMEMNTETGQFIAYSLGDFLSDADRAGTEYSVLLDLEITKSAATNDVSITGYSYTPLFTAVTKDSVRVLRLESAMAAYEADHLNAVSQELYDKMAYAQWRIESRVEG